MQHGWTPKHNHYQRLCDNDYDRSCEAQCGGVIAGILNALSCIFGQCMPGCGVSDESDDDLNTQDGDSYTITFEPIKLPPAPDIRHDPQCMDPELDPLNTAFDLPPSVSFNPIVMRKTIYK